MTDFEILQFTFSGTDLKAWQALDGRHRNWPVVYTLDGAGKVYVGESLNAAGRFKQHLDTAKKELRHARVVLDPTFNKSVCLDLESHLIRWFHGDDRYQVLNRNDGITDADYYLRSTYRPTFEAIFDELRELGAFSRSIKEIENTDLFKLSPFKALTPDQAIAVEDILSGLFDDLEHDRSSRIVIQGDPGTGKTVVGIYLMKLLSDIKNADLSEPVDSDSMLSEFFVEGYPQLLRDFRVGLVVPQQSLRGSIRKVFKKTPGLGPDMVITAFEAGKADDMFDLLIVDEAHRLNQRASLGSGPQNADFRVVNEKLFGHDDPELTQLDWINKISRHQIYLVDAAQAVRPSDLPRAALDALVSTAHTAKRHYRLTSQMRVRAGSDYVGYVRGVLDGSVTKRQGFDGYDLRFFDNMQDMRTAIVEKDASHGLARLLAGYAWPWASKKDPDAFDIVVDGVELRWNRTQVDWVDTPTSLDEVGSIHTIQGYDLNVAGVIIGEDLRFDPERGRVVFDKKNYFDAKGKQNNVKRGITYSDEELLQFVRNIYAVLLTRGIAGTYVYVCDEPLREHLRRFF